MNKSIIFTDLDGTLLEYATYSFEKALPALQLLTQKNIALVICSSKTRREIEYYRKKLNNSHPFVSENGGGIYIPKKYFNFPLSDTSYPVEMGTDYDLIRLGTRYCDLRNAVRDLQREGFVITGFGDMPAEELAEIVHLNIDEAAMAKERDFDEPFIFHGGKEETQRLFDSIEKKGFHYTQGIFFHILGNSDKGRAIALLTDLYRKQFNDVLTVAIGDSLNDLPMLERVNYPVIVQKHDGSYDERINVPHLIKADGIGPDGWNRVVMKLTECW